MARTVDANIVTSAGEYEQTVCYAVEVGYATPKRVTDRETTVTISATDYSPGDLRVGSLVCSGEPANTVTLDVGHDPGDSSDWGRLDLSEDTCGKTVKVYEVWETGAGQKNHLVFEGLVVAFRGGPERCVLTCRRDVGINTRPGNYLAWPDEFPHIPEPGTIIEIGGQAAPIAPAPVNNPHPNIPGAYWSLMGLD
jgi:hypothetical protein